jgi:hypothetical protein
MTNGAFSSRLCRLDKQLRRLEDRLAPPKQSEADRLFLESLAVANARVNAWRVSRGQEPYPETKPRVYPPGHKITTFDLMAILNEGRDRVAAAKKERDAERETAKRDAEARTALDPGTDLVAIPSDSPVSPPRTERS